jgi:hypothetical protein
VTLPTAIRLEPARGPVGSSPLRRVATRQRSLQDLDVGPDALASAGHANDRAEGAGHAAAPADHAPHVLGVDAKLQQEAAVVLDSGDLDRVGVLDDVAGEVLEDLR